MVVVVVVSEHKRVRKASSPRHRVINKRFKSDSKMLLYVHLRRVVCVNTEAGREKKRRVEQPEKKKKTKPTTIERERERDASRYRRSHLFHVSRLKGTFSLEKMFKNVSKNGRDLCLGFRVRKHPTRLRL